MPADFAYDDEAFEQVERMAREWVQFQRRQEDVAAVADDAIIKGRWFMTAMAHARARGIDESALESGLTEFLTALEPDVWFRMAWVLLWTGGLSADEMAKREATEFSNTYTPPMLPTEDWA